jgi:hypothetical protein
VRRTKGGLVPWWVRKRLQEQTQPEQEDNSDARKMPIKGRRKAPNVVEVGISMVPLMFLPFHMYACYACCYLGAGYTECRGGLVHV